MPVYLGRFRIVTRRKEGECRYKLCEKDHKVLPGEQAVVRTQQGSIKDRSVIFYTLYHPECVGPWIVYRCNQAPPSQAGRKVMGLLPKDKDTRAKLIRTRARLLRGLRTVSTGNRLSGLVERIAVLDKEIQATGYPIIQYRGRRSATMLLLDRFVEETKKKYLHPRRVPVEKWKEARELGIEAGFDDAMRVWYDEATAKTIERQGQDFEASQEDAEGTSAWKEEE